MAERVYENLETKPTRGKRRQKKAPPPISEADFERAAARHLGLRWSRKRSTTGQNWRRTNISFRNLRWDSRKNRNQVTTFTTIEYKHKLLQSMKVKKGEEYLKLGDKKGEI